ncbi:hypothetical protein AABB24_038720 [Solanum stoloniferum]|uniref:Signal recognition particle receptor subunit beta n=1 Tax=Solanum stoloniferum TaxID=62892 RepID=A0ABD2QYV9_9SOLN
MEPNEGSFILHSEEDKKGKLKPVHIVDVPGHSHLRPKLDEFLPQAAGVVFVVDFVEFLPNCRPASEYLYEILTKASVVNKKVPVLLLCNKVDKVTAHTTEFIRKQPEKEILVHQELPYMMQISLMNIRLMYLENHLLFLNAITE